MMNMILPILVVVIIAIVAIVFAVKKTILYVDKEYRSAAIISFIFPIVGLIIYAVNIGSNKKLARSCIAPVIAGMIISAIIIIMVLLILGGVYTGGSVHTKNIPMK